MYDLRRARLSRLLLAVLIAFTLLLNGTGRMAFAAKGEGPAEAIVIAGTLITICHFEGGADPADKALVGHACDQCVLCAASVGPFVNNTAVIQRLATPLMLLPAASVDGRERFRWLPSWPRGPPIA